MMRERRKSNIRKKRKHPLVIVLLILTLIILGGYCYKRFLCQTDLPNNDEIEIVKNEGSISIPGYEGLTLQANSKHQKLSLSNPAENNCYFVITLSLQDGTQLWRSDYIKPGETSKPIKLTTKLSAGNYPALMKYECFKLDESKTPLNGAEIKLTLRVK